MITGKGFIMKHTPGRIEVICGGMFAGKTEELIKRLNIALAAAKKVSDENRHQIREHIFVFKPSVDDRSIHRIKSHNGSFFNAYDIQSVEEFWNLVEIPFAQPDIDNCVFAFDEAQFFDEWIVGLIIELARNGARVIVAGLDTDFRGEPFGFMPQLMAVAQSVTKLNAICVVCGRDASRTQRLVNGGPAYYDEPLIVIGDDKQNDRRESYEARCLQCHQVPVRQSKQIPLFTES